jgi:hypothetical protein
LETEHGTFPVFTVAGLKFELAINGAELLLLFTWRISVKF